ncbi:hypothetical protein ASZ90_015816 [hydrocarbon metagenome]|uniref:Uncharacterized protein n=1 Tax=hydrocarbon metagenome TaxID=938273 RepID=A0A0W8F1D2_9ZZZZ
MPGLIFKTVGTPALLTLVKRPPSHSSPGGGFAGNNQDDDSP